MEKRAFGLRKWKVLLSVFHVIFLVITLAGISVGMGTWGTQVYLNGGYGKGIRWIYDETYEDSDAFCSQLGIDISNIFTYIGYKDMFETNGVLDMHKPIVRIIDGPGVDEDMTLDQIVRYAKIRGYYLGEDFTVKGSPMAMDEDDMEVTVEYKTDNPELTDIDGLENRMTKEEMALDILDRLGKYYTIYYNFISNNTNVRFRVLYKGDDGKEVVYTNVPSMSLDELRGFGKYLFIPGNTIRMDSNLAVIPENAASLLETWNPFDNDQNYMVVSVDTSKPEVMTAAAQVGAQIINDVYALRREGALEAAEKSGCGVCLMHMQGEPRTMQKNPVYNDLMAEVKSFLAERAQALRDLGVPAERIVLDPGFGFGKTVSQNFELLAKTEDFLSLGYPLLYGMSRKSSLGAVTGVAKAEERLISSVTAHLLAVERGASIVRVHDVKQMKEALTVYNAMIHYKDLK